VRWIALAASIVCALPLLPWHSTTIVLPATSPFVALGAWLSGGRISLWVVPAVLVAAACAAWRRLFCRYLCPMGLLLDCAGLVAFRKREMRHVPRVGSLIALATWVGAVFGFPLFLWLDPLSLFSAFLGNRFQDGLWLIPAAVIGVSMIWPRLWCTRVCPLGATQDLLRLPADGLRSLALRRKAGPEGERPERLSTTGLHRRTVLAVAAAVVAGGMGAVLGRRLSAASGQTPAPLRPPGAAGEDRFAALCIRCGNCLQVCPAGILRPDLEPGRLASLATPLVVFQDDYCREDCRACTQVCPSGAIRRLSLADKLEHTIGVAVVEFDLCLLAYNRECDICKRVCPRDAVTIDWSDKEYARIPQVDDRRCNGCGACLVACPGKNDWERETDPRIPVRKAIAIVGTWKAEAGEAKRT
ncbi:MAG: 4Fe-4S dicluster domain-containing protein, partial [Planctomycetes bacterium]|nr:4Fe-4S dicluster domain-containing protein [Planctomycetota bacterium]